MKRLRQFGRYIGERKLHRTDLLCVLLMVLAFVLVKKWSVWYGIWPEGDVSLANPYLVQADGYGNHYVIDDSRSRIVKLGPDGKAEYVLHSSTEEADSFWYPEDIAASSDGKIYVLDTSWDDTGSAIGRESILCYNAKGQYEDTLLGIDYEERVNKHKLFALTLWEDGLYYVESDAEGFSVYRLSLTDGEVREEQSYAYEDAFDLIQDYALDQTGQTVYALDKRGRILMGADGGLSTLYDTAQDEEYRGQAAFYRIAADGAGSLYVTDIKGNRLLYFEAGIYRPEIWLSDSGQLLSVTAAVQQDGSMRLGIVLDGNILVQDGSGATVLEGGTFAKADAYRLRETLYQAAAALLALCGLWLVARLLAFLVKIRLSSVQKTGIMAGGTAAVVAVIIVVQLLGQFADIYREELTDKLYLLAYTISGIVDADGVKSIRTSEDYMGEEYQELMDDLELGMNQAEESVQEMYCNVLALEDHKGFAIAYLDNSIGTYYPRDEEGTQELETIYATKSEFRNNGTADETGSYIYVSVPVLDAQDEVAGVIEVGTTSEVITAKIDEMRWNVMITLLLIILIVVLVFSELLSFLDLRDRCAKRTRQEGTAGMPLHLLRCSIFITYLAYNVASSFLPVYAAGFVTDALGLPRELAASLPLTLNMAFVGIMSLFCAPLLHRFSFRTVAGVSGLISMAGDSMLFLGHSYLFLVAGLVLNGVGMGLITNSINMFIAESSEEAVKKDGFSLFNASSLSGVNCGMMVGASLAGMVGQRTVFAFSAAAWVVVAILFLLMGKSMGAVQDGNAPDEEAAARKKTGAFLASRNVVPYILLIQLPYCVINSFVFYYVPIYGDMKGLSENIVCLLLMVNSLCSVYLSVAVTNYMRKRFGEWSIYLSSILSFAALLLFGANNTIPVLVVVLLILGLAGSFGGPVRQLCFTELPAVKEYGEDSAMGIYNFMDSIGESAGPMLFGSLLSGSNNLPGLAGFVGVSAVMNAGYRLLSGRHGKGRRRVNS